MWVEEELVKCRNLYRQIDKVNVRDLLTEQEIECISENSIALQNLRNRLIEPKKPNRICTVTFQRLWDGFDFGEWLEKVAKNILFTNNCHIRVGFSFLVRH